MNDIKKKLRYRELKLIWFGSWFVFVVMLLHPVSTKSMHLLMILSIIAIWIGTVYMVQNKKIFLSIMLGIPILLIIFLFLPAQQTDSKALRAHYVESLKSFEEVTYLWGGESNLGIDCSGLIRQGMIRSNIVQGVKTLNGQLIREAISLWWSDSSAKALSESYLNKTYLLFESSSINDLDHSRLLPGDFAVTISGIHALAYIGDKTWIEADPDQGRVIVVKVPNREVYWFDLPVYIVRWMQLKEAG
jgi:preprotein translocase subunit YajC